MGTWDNWINQPHQTSAVIDLTQAQKLQVTLNREPDLTEGDLLPPAWHWLYFHELTKAIDLGRDGHTRLGITAPDFPLPRRMWAGGKIQWQHPIRLGESAQKISKIIEITEKQGRTGSLIFMTVEHLVIQSETQCIREEQNIVYRQEAVETSSVEPEQAVVDSSFSQSWQLTEVDLFRYSALTFNSHRIHYDSDYVRDIEGYSGLIVHGPLLATLMLDLAYQQGRDFNEFTYRAKSPVILPNSFTVHGLVDDSKTNLWVANQNGALVMQGALV